MSKGIGGHQRAYRGRTDDWITPRSVIESLGEFDLDPCACNPQPWPTAKTMWQLPEDGFDRQWFGRVWLNPPYGPLAEKWLGKLAQHGTGTALIFARTETDSFFRHVWDKATGLLFIRGRLHFHLPTGERGKSNSGAPSVLVAYGLQDAVKLRNSTIKGAYVPLSMVAT